MSELERNLFSLCEQYNVLGSRGMIKRIEMDSSLLEEIVRMKTVVDRAFAAESIARIDLAALISRSVVEMETDLDVVADFRIQMSVHLNLFQGEAKRLLEKIDWNSQGTFWNVRLKILHEWADTEENFEALPILPADDL